MERSQFLSKKIKAWLFFLTVFATATVIHSAKAQSPSNPAKNNYPTSTIRIVVPVAAGGATDVIARAIAPRLTASLNQQVIVDNRVGGGSNIGFEYVAKAQPDGYTLLLAQPAFTVNVSLYKKLAYDPIRDFSPITLAVRGENVLVVHPSVPARNLQEFIKLAKSKPGQLNFGSSGNGTTPHLSGELLKSMAGINIVHVPYKGASAAISEVMGGHIDMAFVSTSSVISQINSGRMRGLAVTSSKRSSLMPNIPTFIESGLDGFEVYGWYGFLAPAGTGKEIISRLHTDIAKALTNPEALDTFKRVGLEVSEPNSPEEFGAFIRAEINKWTKVVQTSGAKAN